MLQVVGGDSKVSDDRIPSRFTLAKGILASVFIMDQGRARMGVKNLLYLHGVVPSLGNYLCWCLWFVALPNGRLSMLKMSHVKNLSCDPPSILCYPHYIPNLGCTSWQTTSSFAFIIRIFIFLPVFLLPPPIPSPSPISHQSIMSLHLCHPLPPEPPSSLAQRPLCSSNRPPSAQSPLT